MVKSIKELKILVGDLVKQRESEFATNDIIQAIKLNGTSKIGITKPRISNFIKMAGIQFDSKKKIWLPKIK